MPDKKDEEKSTFENGNTKEYIFYSIIRYEISNQQIGFDCQCKGDFSKKKLDHDSKSLIIRNLPFLLKGS